MKSIQWWCLGMVFVYVLGEGELRAHPSSRPTTSSTTQASFSRMPKPRWRVTWSPASFGTALREARRAQKLILLDMYATWCGPCKKLDRRVFSRADVGNYVHQYFIPLKRDGYRGEGRMLARRYNCVTYPCVLVIDAQGKEVDRLTRFMEASPFLSRLEEIRTGRETLASLLEQYKTKPKDSLLRYRIGFRYAYRGDGRCVGHLQQVAANPPKGYPWLGPKSLYILGRIYYRNSRRDCASAIQVFQRYLRQYPRARRVRRVQRLMRGCMRRLQRRR